VIILLIILFIILCFGFVLIFGAPYLPTMKTQQNQALDLLDLKPGQTLLELGSGDGRLLITAAKRGINCVGYELNPILFIVSKALCFKYRKLIKIYYGNFWHKKWPPADGIFVFLHPRFMKKLDQYITKQYPHQKVKLVSYAFKIPGKKPAKTQSAIFLYYY
jgi:16S rRNA A1518/A1519 N6-dimethyltransferase RsmA/KsgA/DIM1 with predicted DNA glycosylase/AP lyase activity